MITFSSVTLPGGRAINEDSIKMTSVNENNMCFALADGLGGHGRGDEASALAVKTASEVFVSEYLSERFLENCFELAQERLLKKQEEYHARNSMKTTLVVLRTSENTVQWAHIGDSRLYFFNNNKLIQRTVDHSVPQMLVSAGEIKEKEIRNHPDRNRLLRVIGTEWTGLKYDVSMPVERTKNMAFLLCSDGFWELIEEKTMHKLLKKSQTVNQWLEAMTEEVTKNGVGKDMDNYSAIAVWVNND